MSRIEAVIFDWAGTTVDYGCFAPVQAFIEAFDAYGIEVLMDEVRKPMGMLKRDHIRTMLQMPRINRQFRDKNGRDFSPIDIDAINSAFEVKLMGSLNKFTKLNPYVQDVVKKIKTMGIKIGSTTGYTDEMMDIVAASAKEGGYEPDLWVTPNQVGSIGRPYPYMIFKNMEAFKVSAVHKVVKVGDTVADISEGISAGVYTVGIIEGSSELGLTRKEYESLSHVEKIQEQRRVTKVYKDAGADYVIRNMKELLGVLDSIEEKSLKAVVQP